MMNVVVKNNPDDYTIRQMVRGSTGKGDYQLSWSFNKASHFLLVIHPVKSECALDHDIVPWLEQNGERLLEHHMLTEKGIIWNVIQEREFVSQSHKYIVQKIYLRPRVPYRIIVYPCEIKGENWDIYSVSGDDNVKMIPVSIRIKVTYRNTLFSREKMCMFWVYADADDLEGVLRYKPSGSRCQFPVSVECMKAAKTDGICVCLPRSEELNIIVAPEYRGYYNIVITED